ncbi:MAG: hypothetical protein LBF27_33410 [Sphingobacterium sp.]|jgi:hypothetical protein|nr:hypothetical protein [Sphingobacterium sp.]
MKAIREITPRLIPSLLFIGTAIGMGGCKNDDEKPPIPMQTKTIMIENVLDAKPLVQSGTFMGTGTPLSFFQGSLSKSNFMPVLDKRWPLQRCMDGAMTCFLRRKILESNCIKQMVVP